MPNFFSKIKILCLIFQTTMVMSMKVKLCQLYQILKVPTNWNIRLSVDSFEKSVKFHINSYWPGTWRISIWHWFLVAEIPVCTMIQPKKLYSHYRFCSSPKDVYNCSALYIIILNKQLWSCIIERLLCFKQLCVRVSLKLFKLLGFYMYVFCSCHSKPSGHLLRIYFDLRASLVHLYDKDRSL